MYAEKLKQLKYTTLLNLEIRRLIQISHFVKIIFVSLDMGTNLTDTTFPLFVSLIPCVQRTQTTGNICNFNYLGI
jgi:hypothetical protein